MPRSLPEWIGATQDTPVPPRVRLRVKERAEHRCQNCTRPIVAGERWVADHIVAIVNGGENRERNLQLLCDWCDRNVKTPADVAQKSKEYEIRAKHNGVRPKQARPLPGTRASGIRRRMDGTVEKW